MKIPLYFRILGFIRNKIDSVQFSEYVFRRLSEQTIFFIQIGANDGVSQDPIFRYSGKWKGILVEPLKEPFDKLKENYANRADGKYFENIAIGVENGIVEMYVPKIDANNIEFATKIASIKNNTILREHCTEKRSVEQLTLSALISKHKLKSIDLLVIDVEGYEFDILNNYSFELKPQIIFLETRFYNYNELINFYHRMIGLGYSVFPERDNCLLMLKKNHN